MSLIFKNRSLPGHDNTAIRNRVHHHHLRLTSNDDEQDVRTDTPVVRMYNTTGE